MKARLAGMRGVASGGCVCSCERILRAMQGLLDVDASISRHKNKHILVPARSISSYLDMSSVILQHNHLAFFANTPYYLLQALTWMYLATSFPLCSCKNLLLIRSEDLRGMFRYLPRHALSMFGSDLACYPTRCPGLTEGANRLGTCYAIPVLDVRYGTARDHTKTILSYGTRVPGTMSAMALRIVRY